MQIQFVLSSEELDIYAGDSIVFNSTDYDLQQDSDFETFGPLINSLSGNAWPYLAIWQSQVQDSTASQFIPITMDITSFSYVSDDGSTQVTDAFAEATGYTAPSLYATPFFMTDIQA